MATKQAEPDLTLREEATLVVKEWRDALAKNHVDNPSEANVEELMLVNQILGLLDPAPKKFYQT